MFHGRWRRGVEAVRGIVVQPVSGQDQVHRDQDQAADGHQPRSCPSCRQAERGRDQRARRAEAAQAEREEDEVLQEARALPGRTTVARSRPDGR